VHRERNELSCSEPRHLATESLNREPSRAQAANPLLFVCASLKLIMFYVTDTRSNLAVVEKTGERSKNGADLSVLAIRDFY